MRYITNHRDQKASPLRNPSTVKRTVPTFNSKAEYRQWCASIDTDHVFYSHCEGSAPSERITESNPVQECGGFVGDYDVPIDWATAIEKFEGTELGLPASWLSKTHSGYVRAVWDFEEKVTIGADLYPIFIKEIAKIVGAEKRAAGFDKTSLKAAQYFDIGTDWTAIGGMIPADVVRTCVAKAALAQPPITGDTNIPMEDIAKEIESRFPNRWSGDIEAGVRGPLFWIQDGIDREGCILTPDGAVCFSDRAGKDFVGWGEMFGRKFIEKYETKKLGSILDLYYFNGEKFYKKIGETILSIPRDQLLSELKKAGFSQRPPKGKVLSEVEEAILCIQDQNRVTDIAPIVFSPDRIVEYNSARILNTASNAPVEPAADGDPKHWPFLHKWLGQLFVDPKDREALDYFYGWLSRFYKAAHKREMVQGQAMILVGPAGRGKSLLSNRVVGGLVGGFADASDYLTGSTKFNKELAQSPLWVQDDSVSSASYTDQRRATELLKRSTANPRMEYQAKFADTIGIPWTGRVLLSLNTDANSMAVIPSLDSSNRDKLMALQISDDATQNFPANVDLEKTIGEELPFFAKFLMDYVTPPEIVQNARYGVESYIDPSIVSAAYDNSSRSAISELVDFFSKWCRQQNPDMPMWSGTLTQFQIQVLHFNDGRHVGQSNNLEFCRRGLRVMEEAFKENSSLRPVMSYGSGAGVVWSIGLGEEFDIDHALPEELRNQFAKPTE